MPLIKGDWLKIVHQYGELEVDRMIYDAYSLYITAKDRAIARDYLLSECTLRELAKRYNKSHEGIRKSVRRVVRCIERQLL